MSALWGFYIPVVILPVAVGFALRFVLRRQKLGWGLSAAGAAAAVLAGVYAAGNPVPGSEGPGLQALMLSQFALGALAAEAVLAARRRKKREKPARPAGQQTWLAALTAVLLVFVSCFGFPFYNFSWQVSWLIVLANMGVVAGGCFEAGAFFKKACPGVGLAAGLAGAEGLVILGLACRYLLEFGEVSNTYNFTPANLAAHLAAAALFFVLGARNALAEKDGEKA